jgi:putative hydrolase of the HAD superfamily
MEASPAVDWSAIDTVLLDMDGTLLDLRFDNWFWQEVIPGRYAAAHGLSLEETQRRLTPKFQDVQGTLQWYCIDYWTEHLQLDIAAIKRETLAEVEFLPGALQFLRRLEQSGKRRVLVTNAHPAVFHLKDQRVALSQYFDVFHSSHAFAWPKEHAAFWPLLAREEGFTPQRTLFVDDSLKVLAAAREFGIGWLRAVRRPDSGRPPQATGDFVAIDGVVELF